MNKLSNFQNFEIEEGSNVTGGTYCGGGQRRKRSSSSCSSGGKTYSSGCGVKQRTSTCGGYTKSSCGTPTQTERPSTSADSSLSS